MEGFPIKFDWLEWYIIVSIYRILMVKDYVYFIIHTSSRKEEILIIEGAGAL